MQLVFLRMKKQSASVSFRRKKREENGGKVAFLYKICNSRMKNLQKICEENIDNRV